MHHILAICAAVWLAAGAALAQQADLPALYDVTGVAAGDWLNLRAEPSASAAVLGTLRRDATGIEVIRRDDSGGWGLVNFNEFSGWASMSYLARQPGQDPAALPERLSCYGTEPFWTLGLLPEGSGFALFDAEPLLAGPAEVRRAEGVRGRWGFRAWAEGRGLTGVIARDACTDGMSDREYALTVDLFDLRDDGFTLYAGCCSVSP